MNEWINNLKVGDKVFVDWRGGTAIRTVEKITPAGNVKVNGILFNSNGVERNGDTWNKCHLREITPEALKEFREAVTIQKALRLMKETKNISVEQANVIINLLGGNAAGAKMDGDVNGNL